MHKPTLAQIEAALDDGRLEVHMVSGKWWRLRRNGKTQTWKTRPTEFRIPVKAGLRSCGEITHRDNIAGDFYRLAAPYKWVGDTVHSVIDENQRDDDERMKRIARNEMRSIQRARKRGVVFAPFAE